MDMSPIAAELSAARDELSKLHLALSMRTRECADANRRFESAAAKLEAYAAERDDFKHQLSLLADENANMRSKVADQKHQLSLLADENANMRSKVADLKHQLSLLADENANMRSKVTDLTAKIGRQSESVVPAQAEHIAAAEEPEQLYRALRDERQRFAAEREALRRAACQTVRKLKKKLRSDRQKTARLDAACAELQAQLQSARQSLIGARDDHARVARELRLELSAARIEQRALDVKLASTQAQLARERSLAEARVRVAEFSVETTRRQMVDEANALAEKRIRTLLAAVAERLCTAVPFVGPPTEAAVLCATAELAEMVRG
jgi:septal ring factor EnvC (AmiA/AmiB activator)